MLPQIFKGVAARERRTRATQLLERFGIAAQARRLAGDLSGGQQQRVAICRALINNPTVLLADEPVGNLDSESAEIVMSTLREINERDKKTIVLVTHDASYLKFADRIFYFKDAHIEKVTQNKATGPELLSNHKMVSPEFIGLEKTAHIYPDLTPTQLKAWSLTNYLTETITNEQSLRLEQQLELLLTGTISQQQFFESLHTAYGTGGIGLYWATAASYARTVCDIIAEVAALKKLHGVTTSTAYHHRVIRLLRKYLFQKYRGVLSQTQITRIEDALYRRAQGMIDETTFAKCLAKPLSVGGVGLNIATIKKLQNVLEIIFAQMYEGN